MFRHEKLPPFKGEAFCAGQMVFGLHGRMERGFLLLSGFYGSRSKESL
ncbi:hypothetical protein CB1_000726056 [Acetobacter orientalis]|uniref:Uncharacterized protein n=1 Tax=Acetobacter orientalis TaxID=146474 RepID=A0A2Z5ZIA8_9PROT|nr:hypothetical protein CB1_000726056 [Acetobacter orientalis]